MAGSNVIQPMTIQDVATTISGTSAGSTTALPAACKGFQLFVENRSTVEQAFCIGSATSTCTIDTGVPIQPGMAFVISIPASVTNIYVISASGTGNKFGIVPVVGS
jgi:hypothetical protein